MRKRPVPGFYPPAHFEDVLTSQFFRVVDYFPGAKGLFLARLSQINPTFKGLDPSSASLVPWPSLAIPDDVKRLGLISDRGKLKHVLCPDMVIQFPDAEIVVESEHSKNLDLEQMVQQYLVVRHRPEFAGHAVFHLNIGNTFTPPGDLAQRLRKTWDKLCQHHPTYNKAEEHQRALLWFSWGDAVEVVNEVKREDRGQGAASRLLDEILDIFSARGFKPLMPPAKVLKTFTEKHGSNLERLLDLVRSSAPS